MIWYPFVRRLQPSICCTQPLEFRKIAPETVGKIVPVTLVRVGFLRRFSGAKGVSRMVLDSQGNITYATHLRHRSYVVLDNYRGHFDVYFRYMGL